MHLRPPRPTRTDTLFPCPPLFRSGAAGSSCWVVWNIGGYSSGRVDAVDDELDDAASAVPVIGGQHGVDAALELGRAGEAAHELLEDVLAVAQFFEDARVDGGVDGRLGRHRSEEHTSELQSLMRISYAVFCLKTK